MPDIAQLTELDITTLFAPVAGAISRYRYVNLSAGACIDPILVIDTQLYVTPVMSVSTPLPNTPTNKILLLPLHVCAKVREVQGFTIPQLVDASRAIDILKII